MVWFEIYKMLGHCIRYQILTMVLKGKTMKNVILAATLLSLMAFYGCKSCDMQHAMKEKPMANNAIGVIIS